MLNWFFTLIFTILISNSQASAPLCRDFFSKHLTAYKTMHTPLQPWELPLTGLFVKPLDPLFTRPLFDLIRHRDGTYAILFDHTGAFTISHRLPNNQPLPGTPYLATHRGLYARLQEHLGRVPEPVFGGEILVVGGRVIHLIDQSGTFHSTVSEFSRYGELAWDKLVENNQERLKFATEILRDTGVLDPSTEIINFVQWSGRGNARSFAHIQTRSAVDFEIACRASAACWNKALRIDSYLRDIAALGGAKYLLEIPLQRFDLIEAIEFISMLNVFLSNGTMETLAGNGRLDPLSETGRPVEQFYQNLDSSLGRAIRGL